MSESIRYPQPIILIRGFGGIDVSDEVADPYQGFNHGTVYPHRKGENYIYEGLFMRFLKSRWKYHDATNVVGYYHKEINNEPMLSQKFKNLEKRLKNNAQQYSRLNFFQHQNIIQEFERLQKNNLFSGNKIVIDPEMALYSLESIDLCRTLWVFRYYDLKDRRFAAYGQALVRLIELIRELVNIQQGVKPKVNIIAHSMGGLLVREAVQLIYPEGTAKDYINKIVTLGTPHQGITFPVVQSWIRNASQDEAEHFQPDLQANPDLQESFLNFHKYFPLERLLTVVGTNYHTYGIRTISLVNRLFPISGEYGMNYNRSDGLVKLTCAQIPGAPRTFIHKCHYGPDSLVSSREAFEVATRFFFGNVRSRLRFVGGKVTRGKDLFGKSEFFLGVCIKPRGVDFELFHQSKEGENCYGPFSEADPRDNNVDFREKELAFGWADGKNLIWEGYLDSTPILEDPSITEKDLVMRMDFSVSERDLYGIGFSDNKIFSKQYYIRAFLPLPQQQVIQKVYLHHNERFDSDGTPMKPKDGGWEFTVGDSGFEGTFRIEIDLLS